MGYPQFKNTDISLVVYLPDQPITFDEYREKFGIDIEEIVKNVIKIGTKWYPKNYLAVAKNIVLDSEYIGTAVDLPAGRYDVCVPLIDFGSSNTINLSISTGPGSITMYIFINEKKIYKSSTLPSE